METTFVEHFRQYIDFRNSSFSFRAKSLGLSFGSKTTKQTINNFNTLKRMTLKDQKRSIPGFLNLLEQYRVSLQRNLIQQTN